MRGLGIGGVHRVACGPMTESSEELEQGVDAEEARPDGDGATKSDRRQGRPKGERREQRAGATQSRQRARASSAGYESTIKRYLKLAKDAEKDERDLLLASADVLATLELARTIHEAFSKTEETDEDGALSPDEALDSDSVSEE